MRWSHIWWCSLQWHDRKSSWCGCSRRTIVIFAINIASVLQSFNIPYKPLLLSSSSQWLSQAVNCRVMLLIPVQRYLGTPKPYCVSYNMLCGPPIFQLPILPPKPFILISFLRVLWSHWSDKLISSLVLYILRFISDESVKLDIIRGYILSQRSQGS